MANQHLDGPPKDVEFISDSSSNSRSSSPRPCSSTQTNSSSQPTSSQRNSPSKSESTNEPSKSSQLQSLSTTIINGEIIPGHSNVNPTVSLIDPSKLNITFRMPDGTREHVPLKRSSLCRDLYEWLRRGGLSNHVIWTQFPKSIVPNDSSRLTKVLECNRVLLYVEEKD